MHSTRRLLEKSSLVHASGRIRSVYWKTNVCSFRHFLVPKNMSQNFISNPSFGQLLTNFAFVWTCLRMSGWKTFVKGFWSTYKRPNHKQTLLYKIPITEFLINKRINFEFAEKRFLRQAWNVSLNQPQWPKFVRNISLRVFGWPTIPNESVHSN